MSPETIIALIGAVIPVLGNIALELIRNSTGDSKLKILLPRSARQPKLKQQSKSKNWLFTGITAVIFGIAGYMTGTAIYESKSTRPQTDLQQLTVLETIHFNYADSPLNHGWIFVDGDPNEVFFEEIDSNTVGKALKITTLADNFYGIDYNLKQTTSIFGNFIEIVANYPDQTSSFYVYVEMKNQKEETMYGWLNFKIGKADVLASQKSTGEQEWLVTIKPEEFLDQNWIKMQIDLEEVVQNTFGKDGWSFETINKLRIRGNISIDSIEISERVLQQ
jgi:hypothetical protein